MSHSIAVASMLQPTPSIEERLRKVSYALTLIHAVSSAPADLFNDDLLSTLQNRAEEAIEELYYVNQLPGVVLCLPAPDDDALCELFSRQSADVDGEERDRLREQLVRERMKAGLQTAVAR